MKTIKGRIEKSDVEGGVWLLATDSGDTYQLDGGDKNLYVEGLTVSVTGDEMNDMMGFGMMGPIFKVIKYNVI